MEQDSQCVGRQMLNRSIAMSKKPSFMPSTNLYTYIMYSCTIVGGITVPSMNCLWSPVWRLSTCLESGIIFDIHFIMQNPSKTILKLKLGNSKVLQITS